MDELNLGDIINSRGKRFLIAKDQFADSYPYILIDLKTFEVENGFWELNDILLNYMIDEKPYSINEIL